MKNLTLLQEDEATLQTLPCQVSGQQAEKLPCLVAKWHYSASTSNKILEEREYPQIQHPAQVEAPAQFFPITFSSLSP